MISKKIVAFVLFVCICAFAMQAQNLTIQNVNEFSKPKHKDNLGTFAYGDTLYVKGTYPKETASSITLQLLTFKKNPWTKTAGHSVQFDTPLSGVIDTFIVVPNDYALSIAAGADANTQMLQIRGTFSDVSEFSNLYLNIIEKHPVRKSLIDFDADYGISSGQTLVNTIGVAISSMLDGDTILFKSAEYDFEGTAFTFEKAIYLSGAFPDTIKPDSIGAYDVSTTFKNMKNFNIRSSNVTLANMRFSAIETIGYVFTRFSHSEAGKYYTNILINNVIFENGDVQTFGGAGAGVDFRNVSFLNFKHGGFNCNRSTGTDAMPKCTIKRCKFIPNWDEVFYNTRGASFDAGNDEYPVVWDMSGMHIDSCIFDGNGVGWSKGKNAKVTNCHFIGYRGDVDMIHMEEFTNHIHIEGNLFEYKKPSRTFYIDRSAQPGHHITIINNTFVGKYKWVFWCHSPRNVRFENNDMTQASAKDPNSLSFDFTNYPSKTEGNHQTLTPTENLIIRNNPGINKASIGLMAIQELKNDNSNIIEDYPENKIQRISIDQKPQAIFDTSAIYMIRNAQSKELMFSDQATNEVGLTSAALSDSSDMWRLSFMYPYNYAFKNVKTGNYVEVWKGYTLGDYDNANLPTIYLEQKRDFSSKSKIPHWMVLKIGDTETYQLCPGGNEKKSRTIKKADKVVLELAYDKANGNAFKTPTEASIWEIFNINTVSVREVNHNQITVYPNPAKDYIWVKTGKNAAGKCKVTLFDLSGEEVHHQVLENKQEKEKMSLQGIQAGVYLLRIDVAGISNKVKIMIR